MTRLRGAQEYIVADIECTAHIDEIFRHFIGELHRGNPEVAGLLGHLEAMLVSPGLEPHVATVQPLEPGDDIRGDRLVGMADMRLAVGVRNRGGEIIGFAHVRPGWSVQAVSLGSAAEASNPPISIASSPGS